MLHRRKALAELAGQNGLIAGWYVQSRYLEAHRMDRVVNANGIRLHCIDHEGGEPAVVLLPGLTANASSFDGLVEAGLAPRFRVVAIDLRGRGQSDKPATGYSMAEHAEEMIKPSLGRLGRRFPSWEEYMVFIKKAPFFDGWWEPAIENYYRADVETAV